MAEENGQNKQEYGVPLYTGSWVPTSIPLNKKPNKNEDQEEEEEEEESESKQKQWLILSGGGGQGNSGIPNSILLVQHDGATNSLSQNPVANHGTGTEIPYRMAVHPRGEGLLCSFPESCRWFEWETENNELGIRSSERVLAQLENVGQQLALTFNKEGSVLAVGGEDGHLRVFKWPSMEVILDEAEAHTTVKDLDFSSDGKFLASLGGGGPCRIWDITSSTVVASLPKEKDEQFRYLRFSPTSDNKEILCIAALQGQKVSIVLWDTTSWSRIRSKKISIDSMTAFNVSADGKLYAIATLDAHIHIMNSSSMLQELKLEKAHRGITTALQFSEDSRFLLSTSFDSSVRVTRIEYKKKQNRLSVLMVIALVLAIVAFLLREQVAFLLREKFQTQFIP